MFVYVQSALSCDCSWPSGRQLPCHRVDLASLARQTPAPDYIIYGTFRASSLAQSQPVTTFITALHIHCDSPHHWHLQ